MWVPLFSSDHPSRLSLGCNVEGCNLESRGEGRLTWLTTVELSFSTGPLMHTSSRSYLGRVAGFEAGQGREGTAVRPPEVAYRWAGLFCMLPLHCLSHAVSSSVCMNSSIPALRPLPSPLENTSLHSSAFLFNHDPSALRMARTPAPPRPARRARLLPGRRLPPLPCPGLERPGPAQGQNGRRQGTPKGHCSNRLPEPAPGKTGRQGLCS